MREGRQQHHRVVVGTGESLWLAGKLALSALS